jgi:uncharacterized protein (DUF2384 family)
MTNARSRLATVMEATGLESSDVARILEKPPRSVYRWINEDVEPRWESKERLLEVTFVLERLSQVIKPKLAQDWLYTPLAVLSYDRPVDLIRRGKTREVLGIIDAIGEGAYT